MTREELISRYKPAGDNPDLIKSRTSLSVGTWHVVENILSAETEEQQKCEYCHVSYKPYIQIYNSSTNRLSLRIKVNESDDGSVYLAMDWGNGGTGVPLSFFNFNYCPVCGRKLVLE
ncbi:MAG: hypothetical protein ABF991_11480 [Liquorilactobacillus hordei]|uniref:hypothetical protein n=1 Tax=Liquorilactobacillus hordei TaxID=468911 RepID=UPI0039EB1E3D